MPEANKWKEMTVEEKIEQLAGYATQLERNRHVMAAQIEQLGIRVEELESQLSRNKAA